MLKPAWRKNDKKAKVLIISFSVLIFLTIAGLGKVSLKTDPGFDVHIFARFNAVINSLVAIFLVAALVAVKRKKYLLHKRLMLAAILMSVFFLLSYVIHHLLAGDTRFGGTGAIRYLYFFILVTHIVLASVILPFILFTAYRALVGEYASHRRLAVITWPVWFYVAVTGPVLYLMISPYY